MPGLRVILLCLLVGLLPAQIAYGHPGLDGERVDEKRLRDLLLGRRNTWSDGTPVVLILPRDEASAAAIEELTGMSLPRLLRGWKRLVFAGGGAMPVVVETPGAALDLAARRRGAVALVATPDDKITLTELYRSTEDTSSP